MSIAYRSIEYIQCGLFWITNQPRNPNRAYRSIQDTQTWAGWQKYRSIKKSWNDDWTWDYYKWIPIIFMRAVDLSSVRPDEFEPWTTYTLKQRWFFYGGYTRKYIAKHEEWSKLKIDNLFNCELTFSWTLIISPVVRAPRTCGTGSRRTPTTRSTTPPRTPRSANTQSTTLTSRTVSGRNSTHTYVHTWARPEASGGEGLKIWKSGGGS